MAQVLGVAPIEVWPAAPPRQHRPQGRRHGDAKTRRARRASGRASPAQRYVSSPRDRGHQLRTSWASFVSVFSTPRPTPRRVLGRPRRGARPNARTRRKGQTHRGSNPFRGRSSRGPCSPRHFRNRRGESSPAKGPMLRSSPRRSTADRGWHRTARTTATTQSSAAHKPGRAGTRWRQRSRRTTRGSEAICRAPRGRLGSPRVWGSLDQEVCRGRHPPRPRKVNRCSWGPTE
mmetsp:Transcript_12834/g.34460  ORF Transcript_12834/g.34460 Transcript_12834/m.34460 type:complete len:232 (-) Transcript_12834:376-1071(-)